MKSPDMPVNEDRDSSRAAARPLTPAAGVFDAAWDALQHSELIEIRAIRRKLSLHEIRTFFRVVVPPVSAVANGDILSALRRLTIAARTSGGTAGRDEGLCAACDAAEVAIAKAEGR